MFEGFIIVGLCGFYMFWVFLSLFLVKDVVILEIVMSGEVCIVVFLIDGDGIFDVVLFVVVDEGMDLCCLLIDYVLIEVFIILIYMVEVELMFYDGFDVEVVCQVVVEVM